jgi:hypothetical protein
VDIPRVTMAATYATSPSLAWRARGDPRDVSGP